MRTLAIFLLLAATARADVFNMPAGQTSLQFATVGDPGNVADTVVAGDGSSGFGAVNHSFQMGRYDVTVAQYTQFLNSVAASDPYGLYNIGMTGSSKSACGIVQMGNSGNYSYTVEAGRTNYPVNDINWGDAARFCNWLGNGQPIGPEGAGTTETGAYTLNGAFSNAELNSVARNPGASYFIPSENEWYKAAYYKGNGANSGYWLYPTENDLAPSNAISAVGTNNANYDLSDPNFYLTLVGSFASSPGPYGTFDQGGDVLQWNEELVDSLHRGLRGGWFGGSSIELASSTRRSAIPTDTDSKIGFRVAFVPEPSTLILVALGLVIFARRMKKPAA